jgi:LAS superfamily LD-carboxypeptidase LdcB
MAPGGGPATARWPAPAVREDRRDDAAGASAAPQAGVSEDDGVLPEGVTVFDERHAGVARLDPALLAALRDAATAAAGDGVEIDVNSGWRSAAYQDRLLRDAVATYGTAANAARWVATPATSPHVSGHAVDIGPAGATAWLAAHGASWGLCRIYRNEPWHFELRPRAIDRGCPRLYADPTRDPRMTP